MIKAEKRKPTVGVRHMGGLFLVIVLSLTVISVSGQEQWCKHYISEEAVSAVDWEALLGGLGYSPYRNKEHLSESNEIKLKLNARAAALIDADTGRVLYGKDELTEYPMASTTKIMTCIIALEYGNPGDVVTVSSYAASQPEVRLGIRSGENYVLRDLLYATMLTSYNDCAVAIAEHIGGSVEGFAELMNQKAEDLGCYSTWYITPNGLDAENEGGVHRTTARDLAVILAYAIKSEEFLTITRTPSHSFADCSGKRSFTAVNKNAFLTMMDGALSGKTGYTNDAGYCYAGALRRDGRTFVVALLGSGWPPNRNYKWSDTQTLMNYGLDKYGQIIVGRDDLVTEAVIPVVGGIAGGANVKLIWEQTEVLAANGEQISAKVQIPEYIEAPLLSGTVIGSVILYLEEQPILYLPVILEKNVEEFNFSYCFEHIFAGYFDISLKV